MPNGSKFISAQRFRQVMEARAADSPDPIPAVACSFQLGVAEVLPSDQKGQRKPDPDRRQMLFAISDDTLDRMHDSVKVEGWEMKQYRKNPVVLFGHDSWNIAAPVVGRSLAEFTEGDQLKSLMEFTPQGVLPLADALYELYRQKFMHACSVGFIPKVWQFVEDDDRPYGIDFLEQELLEYSLVPIPANPNALVEARSAGVDTLPLREWSEELLDAWGSKGNRGDNLWIPKRILRAIHESADPAERVTVHLRNESGERMAPDVLDVTKEDPEPEADLREVPDPAPEPDASAAPVVPEADAPQAEPLDTPEGHEVEAQASESQEIIVRFADGSTADMRTVLQALSEIIGESAKSAA